MHLTVLHQLEHLLRTTPYHTAPDLLGRVLARLPDLELQIQVKPGPTLTLNGKTVLTDGRCEYWPIRVPKVKDGEHAFYDYELPWALADYATDVGSTGWDWQNKQSLFWGYDFDLKDEHKGSKGLTPDQLSAVERATHKLPYAELRRSTRGNGLHLYLQLASPLQNVIDHNHHAAYGRQLIDRISHDAGFDFNAHLDVGGKNLWFWLRRATPQNHGFQLLKAAT